MRVDTTYIGWDPCVPDGFRHTFVFEFVSRFICVRSSTGRYVFVMLRGCDSPFLSQLAGRSRKIKKRDRFMFGRTLSKIVWNKCDMN